MIPPTSIDGTDITGATIDGTDVQEITVDGDVVFIAATPGPTLTHHWTLDNADTSGSTCFDIVGNLDGTINGPQTGVSGANDTYTTNEAYRFDGSNDTVDISSNVIDYSQPWTVACWINTDTNHNGIFYSTDLASRVFQIKKKNGGQIQLVGNQDASGLLNTSSVSNNVWHHVAVTYNGNNSATIYVDGTAEVTDSFEVFTSTDPGLIFGATDTGANQYDGELDDVRFYDGELSSTQVNNLYNTGNA